MILLSCRRSWDCASGLSKVSHTSVHTPLRQSAGAKAASADAEIRSCQSPTSHVTHDVLFPGWFPLHMVANACVSQGPTPGASKGENTLRRPHGLVLLPEYGGLAGLVRMVHGTLSSAAAVVTLQKAQQPKLRRHTWLTSATAREGSRAVRAVPVKIFTVGKSSGGASDAFAGLIIILATSCQSISPDKLAKQHLLPKMSGPAKSSDTPKSSWSRSEQTQRQHRAPLLPNRQRESGSSGFSSLRSAQHTPMAPCCPPTCLSLFS